MFLRDCCQRTGFCYVRDSTHEWALCKFSFLCFWQVLLSFSDFLWEDPQVWIWTCFWTFRNFPPCDWCWYWTSWQWSCCCHQRFCFAWIWLRFWCWSFGAGLCWITRGRFWVFWLRVKFRLRICLFGRRRSFAWTDWVVGRVCFRQVFVNIV